VLATVTADFNGDQALDIATANGDSEIVSMLLNNGDGTFSRAVSYDAAAFPSGLAAGDRGVADSIFAALEDLGFVTSDDTEGEKPSEVQSAFDALL